MTRLGIAGLLVAVVALHASCKEKDCNFRFMLRFMGTLIAGLAVLLWAGA